MINTLKWKGSQVYTGTDQNGTQVVIDPQTKENNSISPPDLLLMSLGSCKGIFFLPSAKKLGLDVKDFEITLQGKKSNALLKLFSEIEIYFKIWGNVTKEEIEKAVAEADKKCFIVHSLDLRKPL